MKKSNFILIICLVVLLLFGQSLVSTITGYTVIEITTCQGLQNMQNNLAGDYVLRGPIECSGSATWNPDGNGGYYGFEPIGNYEDNFIGHFDGAGYKINGLFINRPGQPYVGLFGYIYCSSECSENVEIKNIGLENINITGYYHVGGLVGENSGATISNSYSTGSVTGGSDMIGGLVGNTKGSSYYDTGLIINSYSTANVNGNSEVGGLVGWNLRKISNSYSTGRVIGTGENVGGLVGKNEGTCTNCFWNTLTSGQSISACGIGKTTAEIIDLCLDDTSYYWDQETKRCYKYDETKQLCSDPDGEDYYVQTYTYGFSKLATDERNARIRMGEQDTCVSDKLREHYCVDDYFIEYTSSPDADRPDIDCLNGCLNGACIKGSIGDLCSTYIDCEIDLICQDGACVAPCTEDSDCPTGYYCELFTHTCEVRPHLCVGTIPVHSVICSGDNTGLTAETTISLVDTCNGEKCEYKCKAGFVKSGEICHAETVCTDDDDDGYDSCNPAGDPIAGCDNPCDCDDNAFDDLFVEEFAEIYLSSQEDCDIAISSWAVCINPGATEICDDGIDNDCDDFIDTDDSDCVSVPITTCQGLQDIKDDDLTGDYVLGDNIECSGVEFIPIGTSSNKFTGNFDGAEFKINGLSIDRPQEDHVGLFGFIGFGAEIKNVGLENIDVNGKNHVGGLVGRNEGGIIRSSYSTGSVTGNYFIGGLVGTNTKFGTYKGIISNSYSTASVNGNNDNIGGLAGYNIGIISNSSSTGSVTGDTDVGGLVGGNGEGGIIKSSYSIGNVNGNYYVGGLVGRNYKGEIRNSYSNATLYGVYGVGGLVGYNEGTDIKKSIVRNSYSTGSVDGNIKVGGLVGINDKGTCTYSFWDTITSGQSTSVCGTGKITADMQTKSTFINWDFEDVWYIYENEDYPRFIREACKDTDGGKKYYIAGKGTGPLSIDRQTGWIWGENPNDCSGRGDSSLLDYSIAFDCCLDSETSNQLNEAFCDHENGILYGIAHTCSNGCQDGACICIEDNECPEDYYCDDSACVEIECTLDTDCDDSNLCTIDECIDFICSNTPITTCIDYDNCCPSGCDSTIDNDCVRVTCPADVDVGEQYDEDDDLSTIDDRYYCHTDDTLKPVKAIGRSCAEHYQCIDWVCSTITNTCKDYCVILDGLCFVLPNHVLCIPPTGCEGV